MIDTTRIVAIVAAVALVATAAAGTATASSVPDEPVSPGAGEGELTIGVLLPAAGEGQWIGSPGINAAIYARNRINEEGGVLGGELDLVRADEGSDIETASAAIDALLAEGVDAVVGPASSSIAVETLDRLLDAGVLTCSPTATSLLLDNYPDRDLFFRTIPSESLQMAAIAIVARTSGFQSAVVLYLDDQYGRGLASVLEGQLERRGVDLAAWSGFTAADSDLDEQIDLLIDNPDSTIIVLADQAQGMRMLAEIGNNLPQFGTETLPPIYVNDAVRNDSPEDNLALGAPVLRAMRRLGPVTQLSRNQRSAPTDEPSLPQGPYALNTLDCVNLIALAAAEAGSDDPEAMVAELRNVSDGGAGCPTYAQCVALLNQNRDIDYQGANEQNLLYYFQADRGDLGRASVMTYRVNVDNGVDRENGPIHTDWG